MKLIAIRCPNCKAQLKVETDRKMLFCEYCGTQMLIDDGIVRTEHTENLNFQHTYRKIDEARIKEAEVKKAIRMKEIASSNIEDKTQRIVVIGCVIILLICLILPFVMIYSNNRKIQKQEEMGMVAVGFHGDYEGKNYKAVVSQFEAMGFTDIETIDLNDAGLFKNKNDTVDSVSVKGDSRFNSDDRFNLTDKVIISYH